MPLTSRAVEIIICSVVLNILAVLAVFGRFFARHLRKASVGGDDWTVLATLVCSVFLGIFGIWASSSGVWTTPLVEMTPDQYVLSRQVQFGEVLVVHLTIGLIKVSVLLFYKRIFQQPWFQNVSNGLLGLVAIWIVATFFAVIAAFEGVSTYWTAPPAQIKAFMNYDYGRFIIIIAGIDVALDAVIISLPIFVIRTLQMSGSRKIKVTAIFLLGAFCLVASIVRLYYANQLVGFTGPDVATQAFIDAGLSQTLWSRIEISISVVAACLPSLGPVFKDVRSMESVLNSVSSMFSRSSHPATLTGREKTHEKDTPGSSSTEDTERLRNGSNA